ncbi:unnamed protein product [Pylaiella littoralis]
MRGRLKQKFQGEDGVLCWAWKYFLLQIGSPPSLRVTDCSSDGYEISSGGRGVAGGGSPANNGAGMPVSQVSLEGARYAAAWSGINAFNGCGFDLVWASGRTWSLLCEDPLSRKSWVDALNLSIRSAETDAGDVDVAAGAGQKTTPTSSRRLDRTHQPRRRTLPQDGTPRANTDPRHPGDRTSARTTGALDEKSSFAGTSFSFGAGEPSAYPPKAGTTGYHDNSCHGSFDQEADRPQRASGRRRQRREMATERGPFAAAGQPDRCSSDTSEPGSNDRFFSTADPARAARGGDEKEAGGRVVHGTCSTDSSSACLSGEGRRKSRTSERSEKLAKASAATWEQFQQLLERSRRSKARFDKAMDGAAVAATSNSSVAAVPASSSSLPPPPARRVGGDKDGKNGGVEGKTKHGSAPRKAPMGSCGVASHHARKAGAAGDASLAFQREDSAADAGGSSTDRASDVTARSSCVGCPEEAGVAGSGSAGGGGGGGARERRLAATASAGDASCPEKIDAGVVLLQPSGADCRHSVNATAAGVDVDAADHELESSRLSAAGVTDVETSFMLEGLAERSSERSLGEKGSSRSSTLSGSRSSSGGSSSIASGGSGAGGSGGRAAATSVSNHVRQPEADLETARRPAEHAAQAEESLRFLQLAAKADDAGSGRDDSERQRLRDELAETKEAFAEHQRRERDSDSQRLRNELAEMKEAVAEHQKREREAASARALLEREREKERAEVVAGTAATQNRWEARLGEVLAEAAKAERERAQGVRQKEELEKALAAEIDERRRVSSLLDACSRSERALRERVEAMAPEGDLKARLASVRSELEAVSSERDALADELDQCITRLGDRSREAASAMRSRQQREITEISSRCEIEKEALRERLALEAEEKARKDTTLALSAQERRIRAEVAAKAAKDAKRREKQLREAKEKAEAAGEATRQDIEKLRGLHAKRVKRLEALLKDEGENLADARREIAACKATLAGDAGDFQRWAEEQRDQASRLLKELAVIQKKVDRAAATEALAREREGLAMNRLRKVMEEARLERAEGAEVKRQFREALAELESDRNGQARRARQNLQLQRAAEIAQQEVAMVEAEKSRWHRERQSMETALQRLTRLVYGTTNTTNNANSSSTNNANGSSTNNANGSSNHASVSVYAGKHKPTSSPWKPPGGVRVTAGDRGHTSSGANNDTRAACSPIGVNAYRRPQGIGSTRGVAGRQDKDDRQKNRSMIYTHNFGQFQFTDCSRVLLSSQRTCPRRRAKNAHEINIFHSSGRLFFCYPPLIFLEVQAVPNTKYKLKLADL